MPTAPTFAEPRAAAPAPWRARARARRLACAAVLLAAGLFAARPAAAANTLTVAASRAPVSLPLYVAQQLGYFRDEGLDVAVVDCIGGQRCVRQLIEGRAQVATSSEMPVVLHAFVQPDIAVLATMVNAPDNLKLIGRKASGIVRSEQLDGRHVGVIVGTASQYLLETHLLAVGVDPRHVTMVPLQADETVAALRSGRVDAVSVWEPYGYQALFGADPVGVRLASAGGYIETYNLVVSRRGLASGADDGRLVRLLRAVDRAEQFIQTHPAEAQAVLRERLKLDQHFVDWVWGGLGFSLTLAQSLLSTMESEGRWAQREGHVPGGAHPNVLSLVYPGPLKVVKPTAVGTGN